MRETILIRFLRRIVRLGHIERGYFQKIFQNRMVRLGQVERDYCKRFSREWLGEVRMR